MPFNFPTKTTFPDVEDVVCEFLEEQLADVSPAVHVVTHYPDELDEIVNNGEALVLVTRVGGRADYDARAAVDVAAIELSVLSSRRSDSWDIISFLRQRFYDFTSGTAVGSSRVARIDESTGPVDQMFPDPLRKRATFYFNFSVRRPRR